MTVQENERVESHDEEFDRVFDEGGDLSKFLVESTAEACSPAPRRVSVDMSPWMIEGLDKVAGRIAVSRQAVIKTALAGYLKEQGIHAS